MAHIKLLTWNVRGLNDRRKARLVQAYLLRRNIDICFLQETHLTTNAAAMLRSTRWGVTLHAPYSNYSRGVAILIRRGLQWTTSEVQLDTEGRYIIVVGTLCGMRMVLVNVYGPNDDNPEFYNDLWYKVQTKGQAAIMWGGDYNVVLSDTMDRQGTAREHHPKAAATLWDIISEARLIDSWRALHPGAREGTCLTMHRATWSRLDYWLLSGEVHTLVTDAAHLPRSLSDHAPVCLALATPTPYIQPFSWRFPSRALRDQVFSQELRVKLEEYFELNEGSVDSPGTLWEACKVVIRGCCMSLKTGVLRSIRNTLQTLETELAEIEARLQDTPTDRARAEFRTKLTQYQEEADREVSFLTKDAQARRYGEGDRAGRTLANMIRAPRGADYVLEIRDEGGDIVREPKAILGVMKKYYSTLYTSKIAPDDQTITDYLDTIALAWFNDGARQYMDLPFSQEDIRAIIMSMPPGKAPGPDGLTLEFYKEYVDILVPKLHRAFEEAVESGILPQSMREALLITLLKPGKDPLEPDSYRPLSLINVDAKIYAKLLADRLKYMLPQIALSDQSGFVLERSTSHNLRVLFGLLHYLDPKSKAAAALLDATKAFDSLEWKFLYALFTRMGFSPLFARRIGVLYNHPTARVRVNGQISDSIQITRGTRQGCPLSPLLFAVATEPLAARMRQHHTQRSIGFTSRGLLISLYADDITIYMMDPEANFDPLMREVIRYSGLTGININWSKSTMLPLTDSTVRCHTEFQIDWAEGEVKYLGIKVSRTVHDIWLSNFGVAMDWLEGKVKKWKSLPLSLMGRIALAKMVVVPKFLYLFINIPLPLTMAFFARLRSAVIELVWAGRQPRVAWNLLTLPFRQGGLAAPDFELYAYSAQAQFLYYWHHPIPYQPHVAIEIDVASPCPIKTAVYKNFKRPHEDIDTVEMVRWAWAGIAKRAGVSDMYAPSMPLDGNPLLEPLTDAAVVRRASERGLRVAADLYPDDHFIEIQAMTDSTTPTATELLLYYQLRSACKRRYPGFPEAPPTLAALEDVLSNASSRRLITRIYRATQNATPVPHTDSRMAWVREADIQISEKQWTFCCTQLEHLSPNYRLRLIHFNYLHRTYRTPLQLVRMGLSTDASCWRCGEREATFYHLSWTCGPIGAYWENVFRTMSLMMHIPLGPDPLLGLLGFVLPVPSASRKLVAMLLLLAKRQIALKWKQKSPPTISGWLTSALYCKNQLAAYWELMPLRSRPVDIWQPLVDWLAHSEGADSD